MRDSGNTLSLPERAPEPGELVQVRSRRWLVEEVVPAPVVGQSPLVRLACADDDAQGQTLDVYWDYEIDRRILKVEGWADLAKHEWPGTARPKVFYDPRAWEPVGPGGVLHAKAVAIDDEAVFITSANLTEAALDSNIELGLLVRDGPLATSVSTHFQALIDQRFLMPLPLT